MTLYCGIDLHGNNSLISLRVNGDSILNRIFYTDQLSILSPELGIGKR